MLSIRAFSRVASRRSLSRSSPASLSRSLSSLSKPSFLQSAWKPNASRFSYPAFSTSISRRSPAGGMDEELAAKIGNELSLENQERDVSQPPPLVADFLANSGFQIKDTPGKEEIVLTKKFGDEDVKVSFSIADMNNIENDPDSIGEDSVLDDELDEDDSITPQRGGAHTKGAINQGTTKDGNINVAPEDKIAPADRPELVDEEGPESDQTDPAYPVRVNVTIKKPNQGAVQLECVAADGYIDIENVYHFSQPDLADARTAEKDFTRQGVYAGPPFSNLDEDLQVMFDRYIQDRGINEALAQFIPEYIDFKEQREYVQWLGGMKSFIEA